MRSDFIGDCMEYPGLAEAVNDGQYLVPRMGRDALRTAITGPVAVGGGTIAPRLVLRLLNDIGDDHDQLPVLQHALMRTLGLQWRDARQRSATAPLDVDDYEKVGTLRQALSVHAEETYQATGSDRAREIAERDVQGADRHLQRSARRPAPEHRSRELAAITGADRSGRDRASSTSSGSRADRSSCPRRRVPLTSKSIVDVSHESLMRCWDRLISWAEEERAAAAFYVRLSQAAEWHAQGAAGLWRDPELELALRWRAGKPADRRLGARATTRTSSIETIAFLDRSEAERTRERDRAGARSAGGSCRRRARSPRSSPCCPSAPARSPTSRWARKRARRRQPPPGARRGGPEPVVGGHRPRERRRRRAADDRVPAALLGKAKQFYVAVPEAEPERAGAAPRDGAGPLSPRAHRAGCWNGRRKRERNIGQAIAQFEALERERPAPEHRQALGNAYNWLGETLRPAPGPRPPRRPRPTSAR